MWDVLLFALLMGAVGYLIVSIKGILSSNYLVALLADVLLVAGALGIPLLGASILVHLAKGALTLKEAWRTMLLILSGVSVISIVVGEWRERRIKKRAFRCRDV